MGTVVEVLNNLTPSEIAQGVAIIAALVAALFSFLGATTKAPVRIDMNISRRSRYPMLAARIALFAALVGLIHFGATHWALIVSWINSWLKA